MCGIAGIVSGDRTDAIEPPLIHRMCEAMVHRGPDDEGLFVRGNAALGMRRLSIIDLAGGHQPIFNEDRSIWVVFNGEIYNFLDLRAELESRGHRFNTKTDTEVIVHLYEEKGADCVNHLRGMFAFALYNERDSRLLLARDRLGKKPLHYAQANGRLLFGSEIKSILAVAPELAQVNNSALLQYLYFGYILDPNTAFTPIKKLAAGQLLEFEAGEVRTRFYWDLPRDDNHIPASEAECLEELERRVEEAVRIRLISDVPLGALLSGGTDSSTVVAMMARASSRPVKTFSIGFRQADFNEAPYARLVAQKFSSDHNELFLDPDVVSTVHTLTRFMEEPFADSTALPMLFLCQLARQHVTVALSGDGGDELFGGYDRYRILFQRRGFERIPAPVRRAYREYLFPLLPRKMYGRRYCYNVSLDWRERYVDGLAFVPSFERDMPLLSREFRAATANLDPQELMLRHLRDGAGCDWLRELLYLDTKTYLGADILTYVDRISMATSVEIRTPLLDHSLVEWVTRLPSELKLRGMDQKYIFKRLAERIGVPKEVLYRRKQGFAMPLVHWIRHELKEVIRDVLLDPRTLQRGYFEPSALHSLLHEHFSGRRNDPSRIWRVLILELWHRNFMEESLKDIAAGKFVRPGRSIGMSN
jgi:asparagine synthase (glutamine-hydrolysing)